MTDDRPANPAAPRERPLRNARTAAILSAATRQIEELRQAYDVERIVDLGSANPDYLPLLARTTGLAVMGAVRPGAANLLGAELRHIAVIEAPPLEMVRRFRGRGTLFLAMNLLGDLAPGEVRAVFDQIDSAVTFSARGVLSGETRERPKGGWDHNYADLLSGWTLLELQAQARPRLEGVDTIIATAYRP